MEKEIILDNKKTKAFETLLQLNFHIPRPEQKTLEYLWYTQTVDCLTFLGKFLFHNAIISFLKYLQNNTFKHMVFLRVPLFFFPPFSLFERMSNIIIPAYILLWFIFYLFLTLFWTFLCILKPSQCPCLTIAFSSNMGQNV